MSVLAVWSCPGAARAAGDADAAGGATAAGAGPGEAVLAAAALPPPPGLPQRAPPSPGERCLAAVATAERAEGLPAGLLRAIAVVESGRADPALPGRIAPWPWTINAGGTGRVFETREEAVAAVRALREAGVRSIDVGCGQVNLHHHPSAFASLEEAFEPEANLAYAARFLRGLHASPGGGWARAAAAYHSQTPEFAAAYALRVMAAWPDARRHGPWPTAPAPAAPAATPPGAAAPPPISYGLYTPEFATRLRRIEQDRLARMAAPLQPVQATTTVRAGRGASAAPPPGPVWVSRPPEPLPLLRPPTAAGSPREAGRRGGTGRRG